jgi:hypothetical protein
MLSTENCFSLVSLRHIDSAVVWFCWHVWRLGIFCVKVFSFLNVNIAFCVCQMYSCAVVASICRPDLEFDVLITTNNSFFVRKCRGWCNNFKFAFKLVFL